MRFLKNNKQNIKCILALVLWGVLAFPSILDLIHQCDSHSPIDCKENKAHLHPLQTQCEVCDFNLLTFDYKINEVPTLGKNRIFVILDNFFVDTYFHSFSLNYTQLRAPPMFS